MLAQNAGLLFGGASDPEQPPAEQGRGCEGALGRLRETRSKRSSLTYDVVWGSDPEQPPAKQGRGCEGALGGSREQRSCGAIRLMT